MRARAGACAAVLLAAGCSGSSPSADHTSSRSTDTLEALWSAGGPKVSLVAGDSDFSPGDVRFTFLILGHSGRSFERPRADVWVARGLRMKPFLRTSAALEQIGVPGGAKAQHDIGHLYVAHLNLPKAGKYWVLAKPVGGRPIRGLGNAVVREKTLSPAIGSKAIPSDTPTITGTRGDFAKLTTRVPPDRALLRYSIAESLQARKPFVVVFATPKFCVSRTCGPVVDVVDAVRKRFAGSGIRFIHVEIYRDNDPAKGFNRWVTQWHLSTEPWIFLVGADGRIKAKFEGSVSTGELRQAVEALRPDSSS